MTPEEEELRRVIAWANNSLYGSHNFFLSLNGGKNNEHHLDDGIEKLKESLRLEQTECERLKKINVEHCRAVNTYIVANSREEDKRKAAEKRLTHATQFTFKKTVSEGYATYSHNLYIEARGNERWVITSGAGWVLNKDKQWENEPLPSNREDDFIERTRYTLDEAFEIVENLEEEVWKG